MPSAELISPRGFMFQSIGCVMAWVVALAVFVFLIVSWEE